MLNFNLKKLSIFACILLLQPMVNPGSFALAKRRSPPKAYSFIAEGGKASQGECDGERKIPRLKKLKEFSKSGSYMGSELQDPELKGKADDEMWKHFFRAKPACNSALAKVPSSIQEENLKTIKTAIPDEEAVDEADEATRPEVGESSEAPEAE